MVFKNDLSSLCCRLGSAPDIDECCIQNDYNSFPCFEAGGCTLAECCDNDDCCDSDLEENVCCTSDDPNYSFTVPENAGVCCQAAGLTDGSESCGNDNGGGGGDSSDDNSTIIIIDDSTCVLRSNGIYSSKDGPCCFLTQGEDAGTYTSNQTLCEVDADLGDIVDPEIDDTLKDYDWKDPSKNIDTLTAILIAIIIVFLLVIIICAIALYLGYRNSKKDAEIDWGEMFAKDKGDTAEKATEAEA